MNPYMILNSALATPEGADLTARLTTWHDAMVSHERRLRSGNTSDACSDECPHAEARALWAEAVAAFGIRAQDLTFLRTRAVQETRRAVSNPVAPPRAKAADYAPRRTVATKTTELQG